jgi:flagellar basal-body rod protein FlgF
MSTGIWSAASGAVAQGFSLDIASNNIANANTPGFRADRAVFRQQLAQAVQRGAQTGSLRYAKVQSAVPSFEPGQLVSTGAPMDVALKDANTFFVVQTPNGERYTRVGRMGVGPNGAIVSPEGWTYLDAEKRPLKAPAEAKSITIGKDGTILADGAPSGKLLVVKTTRPEAMQHEGTILFRAGANAGIKEAVNPELEQGAIEGSNASVMSGMTNLITASRQFEMLTKVVEAFSTIDHKAATDLMRR